MASPTIRQLKNGSVVIETSNGSVIEMNPVDAVTAEKLARKQVRPILIPGGSGQQLIRLKGRGPIANTVIKDRATTQRILRELKVEQGLGPEANQHHLDQFAKVPHSGKMQFITADQANQRSRDACRSAEWQGQRVAITTVPAGTILIQIATDALPLTPIGKEKKSHDSQAYQIAKAIYEGESASALGSYFLISAPRSPAEAAMFAAILDIWKQGCTHFTVVLVTEPFLWLVGQIARQENDSFIDAETGTIMGRALEGGVLQCNPVDLGDFMTKVKILNVHQLAAHNDPRTVRQVLDSGLPGGAMSQELFEFGYKQQPHGAFGD